MVTFLCVTDFSASSENAIKYASELAQFFQSRIILFHSVSASATAHALEYSSAHDRLTDELEERMEYVNKLETLKMRLECDNTSGNISYETYLKHGAEQDTLPALIEEERVDVVITGREDASSLPEVAAGAVTAGIMASTCCPVLVIPQAAAFKPVWKIVFASDLKNAPFTGMEFLLKIATLFKAEIMLLHMLTSETEAHKELLLEELTRYYQSFPYSNISLHIENNSVEAGISEFSRHHKADMLVVGYHPRERWKRLLPKDQAAEPFYHNGLPLLIMHCTL
ncbi:universal stress protein [Pontibacter beigongshangensis]|uniref:universal stress protein n=1 Tax=Pontibacter beigongshangensis TaxID=2574733 RepID=UPI001650A221|nr:universal stress protein [Pontibacter beigongshangensis]